MIAKLFSQLFLILLLVLLATVLLSAFGVVKFLVVGSGSMEPALPLNSLVVTVPQKSFLNFDSGATYKTGDVISFKRAGEETLVTHRIVGTETYNDRPYYRTQGDANQTPDSLVVAQSAVVGKAAFSIPEVGNFLTFLQSLLGLFLIVILPASFIILHEVLAIADELKKEALVQKNKTAVLSLVLLGLLLFATPVSAQFKPQATLEGNTLTTFTDFNLPTECNDIVFTGGAIVGTSGNDKLAGTSGNDLILGLEGNDKIDGKGGADCIVGGEGNDYLDAGSGNDVVLAGAGNDHIDAGSGEDTVFGESGNDKIVGGSGSDQLTGGLGEDHLLGGSDNDILHGGDGNDTMNGGSGADQLFGENDNDNLKGGSENDSLDGGGGINVVDGQDGTDTCVNGPTLVSCELP